MLGAILLGIIVLFVSCSGDDKNDQGGQGTGASQPAPAPGGSAAPEPSFLDSAPGGGGPSLPAPGDLQTRQPGGEDDGTPAPALPSLGGGGVDQNTNVTVPADGSCADSEISVTPIPATTSAKRGAAVDLTLKIKNVGTRTCTRDVGADPQELYLVQGAHRYWSSDTCSTSKGSNARQLRPGEELAYNVTWNGRQSNTCTGGNASGPNPPPGQFQLLGRLGTLVSNPVSMTIVG